MPKPPSSPTPPQRSGNTPARSGAFGRGSRDLILDRLAYQASTRGTEPALFSRGEGKDAAFVPITWSEYHARVLKFAGGCAALDLPIGSAVAIVAENRAEWVFAALGAMAAGGMMAGIYQTSTPDQVGYILAHSDAIVAVVEDAAQLAKVTPHVEAGKLPKLRRIVLMSGGVPEAAQALKAPAPGGGALCQTWADFQKSGEDQKDAVARRLESVLPDQVGTLIYTSGTTGNPKGVMLTHSNLAWTAQTALQIVPSDPADTIVSYLPLSHIAEQMFTIYLSVTGGMRVYFAGSIERLRETLLQARPTVFLGVPRVWEKLQTAISAKLAASSPIQRRVIAWARDVGTRAGRYRLDSGPPYGLLSIEEKLARKLFFTKLKTALGLDRLRIAMSGAAPIRREVLEFFLSLEIPIYEVYGQSECSGPLTCNGPTPGHTRLGTVGLPLPGTNVKLGSDGEVLLQGPNVFAGYFKDPAATETALEGGWLCTGDVGEWDEPGGFLRITDRKKDLFKTSGGKYIAPQVLEGHLRSIPLVSQAVVVGEGRKYVAALLTLDPERSLAFAKEHGLPTDPAALAEHPKVVGHIEEQLAQRSRTLARYETVKRIAILPRDFSVEAGEVTPSQKLRRNVILKRYADKIDAMYPPDEATDE